MTPRQPGVEASVQASGGMMVLLGSGLTPLVDRLAVQCRAYHWPFEPAPNSKGPTMVITTPSGCVRIHFHVAAYADVFQRVTYKAPELCLVDLEVTSDGVLDDMLSLVAPILDDLNATAAASALVVTQHMRHTFPAIRHAEDRHHGRFRGWSIVFRDHFVENFLGLTTAFIGCGVEPGRILALSKGDRTSRRREIAALLQAMGVTCGVFDNADIDVYLAEGSPVDSAVAARVKAFEQQARAEGNRVLVIDDGGLVALVESGQLGGFSYDAALELTVAGLRRIEAASSLSAPVFDMAHSELKQLISYREIADACLRRIRELVPSEKFIGRRVLTVGFGTLGAQVTDLLRSMGCQVGVVDRDPLKRIRAFEKGLSAWAIVSEALVEHRPFLMVLATGEDVVSLAELDAIGVDDLIVAPLATRDIADVIAEAREQSRLAASDALGLVITKPDGSVLLTILGDGRSLNLFDADPIPNRSYDLYRAGTLALAAWACRDGYKIPPGVHRDVVNAVVRDSGIYEDYIERYFR